MGREQQWGGQQKWSVRNRIVAPDARGAVDSGERNWDRCALYADFPLYLFTAKESNVSRFCMVLPD